MIDVENAVFNTVATNLRSAYSSVYTDLKVYGEYVEFPESFPCVSTWCTDNYTYLPARELSDTEERYVNTMFTTEVYAVGPSRKAIAKQLADNVDASYREMGFTRAAMMVLPNVDRNAYRITMRHTGLVEKPLGDNNTLISLVYR